MDNSDIKHILDYKQLSLAERRFVIELLAAMRTPSEIQQSFSAFNNGTKTISIQAIKQVEKEHIYEVRTQNELYLKHIEGNPLAHRRIRLDIYNKVVTDAFKEIIEKYIQNPNDESFEGIPMKRDYGSIIRALDAARKEMQDHAEENKPIPIVMEEKEKPIEEDNSNKPFGGWTLE